MLRSILSVGRPKEIMALTSAALDEIERELTPATPHDVPPGPLYHYTDASGFKGIVSTGSLWATHYGFLNDTEELLIGERVVSNVASDLLRTATGLQRHFLTQFLKEYEQESLTKIAHLCVASLSEDGDSLSQWRAYAAGGGGYSIGFSQFRLPDAEAAPAPDAQMGLWLMRCVYDKSAIEAEARTMLSTLTAAFEAKTNAHGGDSPAPSQIGALILAVAMRRSATVALRLKHDAFREEREWRLIAFPNVGQEAAVMQFRASARGLVPYVILDQRLTGDQLALSRVFVGPTQDQGYGSSAAALFLSGLGYPGSNIVQSSIVPFRGNA